MLSLQLIWNLADCHWTALREETALALALEVKKGSLCYVWNENKTARDWPIERIHALHC